MHSAVTRSFFVRLTNPVSDNSFTSLEI